MQEIGRYNLGNETLINANNSLLQNIDVTVHERIHSLLCCSSSYGLITIMLKKNSVIHEEKNWLLSYLCNHMKRMQEIIATGVELMNVYSTYGKEEYCKRLMELKSNPTYYNYYRKLLWCGITVNNVNDANNISSKLVAIGILSLNIDLTKIPFESIQNEKEFQTFLSKEGNNIKFIPNRRFETFLAYSFMNNATEKVMKRKALMDESTILSLNSDYIRENAYNAIKKVYSNSSIASILIERTKTIGSYGFICPNGVSPEYLTSYPLDFDNYKKISYEQKLVNNDVFFSELSKLKSNIKVVRLEHLCTGLEDLPLISLWDLNESELITTRYSMEFFDYYVKKCTCPIVFMQKKLFSRVKYKIKGLSYELPIYLLMDNCIAVNLEFIFKHFNGGNYTYYGEDSITLIIYRGSYVLIQFIIKNLVNELESLLSKENNITYVPFDDTSLNKELLYNISREGLKLSASSLNLLDNIQETKE